MTMELSRLVLLAMLLLLVAACAARAASTSGPSATAAPRIDAAEARALLERGGVLVDVRSAAEFRMGHIDGAINLPVGRVRRAIDTLPGDGPIVVYCLSGHRSARAARELAEAGRAEVYDLGSLSNWD